MALLTMADMMKFKPKIRTVTDESSLTDLERHALNKMVLEMSEDDLKHYNLARGVDTALNAGADIREAAMLFDIPPAQAMLLSQSGKLQKWIPAYALDKTIEQYDRERYEAAGQEYPEKVKVTRTPEEIKAMSPDEARFNMLREILASLDHNKTVTIVLAPIDHSGV